MKVYQFIYFIEKIGKLLMLDWDKGDQLKDKKALINYPETFIFGPTHGGVMTPKYIILYSSPLSFSKIKALVLNVKSKISYHYLISPDGSLIQFLPNICSGRRAGVSRWGNCVGLNNHSIFIIFSDHGKNSQLTDDQVESCSKKCADLLKKFNLTTENILTHRMVSSNPVDEISSVFYEKILKRVGELTS